MDKKNSGDNDLPNQQIHMLTQSHSPFLVTSVTPANKVMEMLPGELLKYLPVVTSI